MSEMVLFNGMTIRTAYPKRYQELVDDKKLFKRSIHLFTAALAVGVVLDQKSKGKKPHHDLIRLSTVTDKEQRSIINVLSRIACKGEDKKTRGQELLAYADGGLEKIWEEYQALGNLDLPRLLEKIKKKCSQRASELITNIQHR